MKNEQLSLGIESKESPKETCIVLSLKEIYFSEYLMDIKI